MLLRTSRITFCLAALAAAVALAIPAGWETGLTGFAAVVRAIAYALWRSGVAQLRRSEDVQVIELTACRSTSTPTPMHWPCCSGRLACSFHAGPSPRRWAATGLNVAEIRRACVRMADLALSARTCHRFGQRRRQGSGMLSGGFANRVLMTLQSDFRAAATGSR